MPGIAGKAIGERALSRALRLKPERNKMRKSEEKPNERSHRRPCLRGRHARWVAERQRLHADGGEARLARGRGGGRHAGDGGVLLRAAEADPAVRRCGPSM